MVSQDVEENLSKRFIKWGIFFAFSLILLVLLQIFRQQTGITIYVLVVLFTLFALFVFLFNLFIYLKIRAAIKTYYAGNYEKAKDMAIVAFKLSSYKEINDFIDYVDSQIIDDIITQQERLEMDQELSDYLIDLNDLESEINIRIKRQEKHKLEIEDKLKELQNEAKKHPDDVGQEYKALLKKYQELLEFSEYKLNAYKKILELVAKLKNMHQSKEKIMLEHEDYKDIEDKILSEGGATSEEDEDNDEVKFYRNEKILVEYIKEFLASTTSVESSEDFSRIYKEFDERVEELDLPVK